jgi:hypothetical protein
MKLRFKSLVLPLVLVLVFLVTLPASAHQPFFEEEDITSKAPWPIVDPTVSTVVYATLQSPTDVDYFVFEGQAGERILLEITIPQIEGQDAFAPTMALMGPGLGDTRLPGRVQQPTGDGGALEIAPEPGPAETFYEPFSRTSYWERQSQRVTLPESGRYWVAVWHPDGQVGRYGFVIGDKERLGGDLLGLATKMRSYWTPVEPAEPARIDEAGHMHSPEALKDPSDAPGKEANPFGTKPAFRWPEGLECSSP